ncbi:MAG: hypothetical protein WD512_13200, partial [Candidatus Paceibacterota bacterium]
ITQSLPANIIYLLKDCSVNKLKHLSECEHFDIAYVKNHNNLTQEYAEAIARLGEHLFISLKPDERTLSEGLKKLNFNSIDSPLDSLLYKKQQISFLKRTSWYQDSSEQNNVRHIKSTYEEKIQYKNYGPNPTSNTWLPGINLMTFKTLNGQIPSPETCSSEIERLYTIPHSDWMPNNIIVQGQNLELIDFEDPYINGTKDVKAVHTPKMLEFMKQFVTESDTTKIEENYKKLDTYCRIQIHGRSFFRFLRIL